VLRRKKEKIEPVPLDMTPMIDCIFLLLLFFLLSCKFIALEGQLSSFLPKDRGLQATAIQPKLVNVTLFLQWVPEGSDSPYGEVVCQTIQYHEPDGTVRNQYKFGMVNAAEAEYGPPGRRSKVEYKYSRALPDFDEIEGYLQRRHETYVDTEGLGKGLPVTINFEDKVPAQMVVNLLDICIRLGITDFTLAAQEEPY
jgi:hypothetical protein